MSDFDYNKNETITNLKGTIETPKKWNIGCIVGSSGSGKSTIARGTERFWNVLANSMNTLREMHLVNYIFISQNHVSKLIVGTVV